MELNSFMESVKTKNPNQPEFHQAVLEVANDVIPYINTHEIFKGKSILERMVEPDRAIIFRVSWEDDQGDVQVNRGFRVQYNNSIGPYKGGLRFDPSVNLGILKFLGFEQVFKNALTTLPMGGAKGGSDFNPKGKSDHEVMRFCQSFMTELFRHIGPDTDVPAGDIGVGGREIGYLFGQYKRLANEFTGTFTGKGIMYGGSPIRPEATGYGCVFFAKEMLEHHGKSLEGKICLVSGSGNVAQYAVEKLNQLGAKVVCMSDRNGYIHDPEGINQEKLQYILELKNEKRTSIEEYVNKFKKASFTPNQNPWKVPCNLAFPCATQNEISGADAAMLVKNGCELVSEGANMPTSLEGTHIFQEAGILFAPGKAANAGGVAISGIEMTQNSMRLTWAREEVESKLKDIMRSIHKTCVLHGTVGDKVNYVKGANLGGFVKVAEAMIHYGIV